MGAQFGVGLRLVDGGNQPVDDGARCTCRHHDGVPRAHIKTCEARLGHGWYIGPGRHAFGRRHGQRFDTTRPGLRRSVGHDFNHVIHLAADQIRHGLCPTAVGNVHGRYGCARFVDLASQVRGGAVAGRAEGVLARAGLEQSGQVGHRIDRQVGSYHHHGCQLRELRHRLKILERVETRGLVNGLVDGQRTVGAVEQRVAISWRFGCRDAADIAARTGKVFKHNGLAQFTPHSRHDQARQDVTATAGRERHDDLDGFVGVGSNLRMQCGYSGHGEQAGGEELAKCGEGVSLVGGVHERSPVFIARNNIISYHFITNNHSYCMQ